MDGIKNIKINFLFLSKAFFLLLLLYYGWFQMVFFNIPNMSMILGILMILFLLFDSLVNRKIIIESVTSEIFFWLLFIVFSAISGFFIAVNKGLLVNSIAVYTQQLVMIYGMVYISKREKRVDSIINICLIFVLVCALTTVLSGVRIYPSRISMGGGVNPNYLGFIMALGVFCALYKLDFNSIKNIIIYAGQIILFIYVLILSASRQHFLSCSIIVFLWICFQIYNIFKKKYLRFNMKIIVYSFIGLAVIAAFTVYVSNMPLFQRMAVLFAQGDATRVEMYKEAIELFRQSPYIGVGMDNFRELSVFKTYSHSTYAEALACTGIIGSILYFVPYLILLIKTIRLVKKESYDRKREAFVMLSLLVSLLFTGLGTIHFYSLSSSVSFGIIIAFASLHFSGIFNKRV